MGRQWQDRRLDDSAWRPPPGLNRADRAAEQDQAAGGRDQREIPGTSRPVLASIYFRRTAGRRVYAYLRWADADRTSELYVCEATHDSRAENLSHAWNVVRDRKLLASHLGADDMKRPGAGSSWAGSEVIRRQMQANRGRDTRPELALRSYVHRLGLRYKVAARPLPSIHRTADLVFTRAHVAVFLDGCFWHGCPEHHRPAQRNEDFWREKIARNRERDAETDSVLQHAGWTVVRVWEHENPQDAADRVAEIVSARRTEGVRARSPGYWNDSSHLPSGIAEEAGACCRARLARRAVSAMVSLIAAMPDGQG